VSAEIITSKGAYYDEHKLEIRNPLDRINLYKFRAMTVIWVLLELAAGATFDPNRSSAYVVRQFLKDQGGSFYHTQALQSYRSEAECNAAMITAKGKAYDGAYKPSFECVDIELPK
jgi:hypothetical protein